MHHSSKKPSSAFIRIFTSACVLTAGSQAHAELMAYSSLSSFSSVLTSQGTDAFSDIATNTAETRTAGPFTYGIHAYSGIRPLVVGSMPDNIALHAAALLVYGSLGYVVALALTRKRLLK